MWLASVLVRCIARRLTALQTCFQLYVVDDHSPLVSIIYQLDMAIYPDYFLVLDFIN